MGKVWGCQWGSSGERQAFVVYVCVCRLYLLWLYIHITGPYQPDYIKTKQRFTLLIIFTSITLLIFYSPIFWSFALHPILPAFLNTFLCSSIENDSFFPPSTPLSVQPGCDYTSLYTFSPHFPSSISLFGSDSNCCLDNLKPLSI